MTKRSMMLIVGLILMMTLIHAGGNRADAAYETVEPEEDTKSFIKNHAMGWVLYVDAFSSFPNARYYWWEQEYNCEKASILYS